MKKLKLLITFLLLLLVFGLVGCSAGGNDKKVIVLQQSRQRIRMKKKLSRLERLLFQRMF